MPAIRIIDDHLELANIGSNTHAQIDTHIAAADDYVKRDGSLSAVFLEMLSATPYLTIHNTTHEDTDYGREGEIVFKGEQSGGEETTLGKIQVAHDGTADDQKGIMSFKVNDGADGDVPTTAMTILANRNVGINTTAPAALLDIHATSFPAAVYGITKYGQGDWAINLGDESVANVYIGLKHGHSGGSAKDNYFWRANWNTAGAAINTFKNANEMNATSNSFTTMNVLGKTGQTGDLFSITSYGGSMGDLVNVEIGGNIGIGTIEPTAKLDIDADLFRLRTAKTPATAGADGNAGNICWDANYLYIAVATNTWKRAAMVTW